MSKHEKKRLFFELIALGVLLIIYILSNVIMHGWANIDVEKILSFFFLIVLGIAILTRPISKLFKKSLKLYKNKKYYDINNISFNDNKLYFREIIDEYSIAELSFIDGFEFLHFYDVIAMLLKLERMRVISVDNGKIIVLDFDNPNLKKSEKYLLDSIKNGDLMESDLNKLEKIVKKECVEDGLIDDVKMSEKGHGYIDKVVGFDKAIIIAFFAIVVCLLFVAIYVFNLSEKAPTFPLYFAVALIVLLIIGIFIIFVVDIVYRNSVFSLRVQMEYNLSDKGKDLYLKLQGLKRYIKDFSNLKDKDKEHLQLWDDYLIYSVMFGLNKQIPDKYTKIFKGMPDISLSVNGDKGIYFSD